MMLWRNNDLLYLCSVIEVPKLSFPTDQCKWICHAKSQLKTWKSWCIPWTSMATDNISLKKLYLHKIMLCSLEVIWILDQWCKITPNLGTSRILDHWFTSYLIDKWWAISEHQVWTAKLPGRAKSWRFSLMHPQRAKRKKELLVVYAPSRNVLDFLSYSKKNWFLLRWESTNKHILGKHT